MTETLNHAHVIVQVRTDRCTLRRVRKLRYYGDPLELRRDAGNALDTLIERTAVPEHIRAARIAFEIDTNKTTQRITLNSRDYDDVEGLVAAAHDILDDLFGTTEG